MDTNTDYYLLLIDIINSTKLSNEDLSLKMDLLEAKLVDLNNNLNNNLVLPLSISYGDEIAGLFKTPENIFNVVEEIRKFFYPITSVRYVVVKGSIARVSLDIRKIGGIIFKKANKTIDVLKKNNRFCSWQLDDPLMNKSLESLCEISNVILQDMSEYQRNVFELYREGLTQKQIAIRLEKHTQSIWDAIQRSKANYIIDAELTINLILKDYELLHLSIGNNSTSIYIVHDSFIDIYKGRYPMVKKSNHPSTVINFGVSLVILEIALDIISITNL